MTGMSGEAMTTLPGGRIGALPEAGYMRLKQVLALIPVSATTWWQWIRDGLAPRGIKWGNITVWKAEDIRGLLARLEEGLPHGGVGRRRGEALRKCRLSIGSSPTSERS